jgi:predicted nucleotidyltransferase
MSTLLTQPQSTAARGFIAEQALLRRHLVVYLSGAHAYGFPSPDSDLDLKCIHVAPTRDLVGMFPSDGGAESMVVRDGIEVDYGSNELGAVLRGVIKGNGNFLERILGELVLDADYARLAELQPLVRASLSRRVHRHYAGFAGNQLRAAEESPTAKRVLYVLRTALTGTHLLRTGALITDLTQLMGRYGLEAAQDLIAIKQRGEKVTLSGDDLERWRGELARALAGLDAAAETSALPEEPPQRAVASLDDWLQEVRRVEW